MFALYADGLSLLEHSALGHVSRHSAWLFTSANLLHVLGAAFVVGGIGVFDLKVLRDHGTGVAAVGRVAIPIAAAGLAIQMATGLVLLSVEATKLGVNPACYAKFAFIAVGLVNLIASCPLWQRHAGRGPARGCQSVRRCFICRMGSHAPRRPHDRLSLSGDCQGPEALGE